MVDVCSVELTVSALVTVRFVVVKLLIVILDVCMVELTTMVFAVIVEPVKVEYASNLVFIVDAIRVEPLRVETCNVELMN
jgi:hypothetical protein